jgi:hypothetical protein
MGRPRPSKRNATRKSFSLSFFLAFVSLFLLSLLFSCFHSTLVGFVLTCRSLSGRGPDTVASSMSADMMARQAAEQSMAAGRSSTIITASLCPRHITHLHLHLHHGHHQNKPVWPTWAEGHLHYASGEPVFPGCPAR